MLGCLIILRVLAVNSSDIQAQSSILNGKDNFARSFGRKGSNLGEFNDPFGVALDKDGNVLVADRCNYRNHRIQIFTGEEKYISMFGITISSFLGVYHRIAMVILSLLIRVAGSSCHCWQEKKR